MSVKRTVVVVACFFSPVVALASSQVSYDRAEVTSVTPITRTVHIPDQHRECWFEEVTRESSSNSSASTIVGGVVGGIVGNQFGKGHGKKAATIAGTILGGSVGREMASQNSHPKVTQQQRCRVIDTGYDEERVEGYQVAYNYNGKSYRTRTEVDPGETIKIRVQTSVTPVIEH